MIIDFERIKHNYSSITPGDVVVLKFQASCEIGLGHLSRMLTLAGMLKNSNKAVICAVNNNDTVIKKLADRGLHYEVNQFSKQEHFIDYMLEKYKPNAIVIDEKYHYSAKDITRWQKISQLICIDNIKKD